MVTRRETLIFSLIFISWFVPIGSAIADPITIAVLDSPVDYSNPSVANVIDFEKLKQLFVTLSDGTKLNLYDLNQLEKQNFESDVDID